MNLFFINDKNEIFYRPDTTLNKECPVYYVPDSIRSIEYAPFIYVKIDRAGKYIAPRFAPRYYSKTGQGLAIFGYESEKRDEMLANLLDNSTIVCELTPIESISDQALIDKIDQAISTISEKTSLKTGDYVCLCSSIRTPTEIGETVKISEERSLLIK